MGAPKGNKFALGNNGGKPPYFKKAEELEKKCLEYFQHCIDEKEKPTITGLTLYVGFCERKSWDDYAKKTEFVHIVKRAKLTVENSYEMTGGTIDIFALKQMGWKDKTEVDSINTNFDITSLSDEEITTRLNKARRILNE